MIVGAGSCILLWALLCVLIFFFMELSNESCR